MTIQEVSEKTGFDLKYLKQKCVNNAIKNTDKLKPEQINLLCCRYEKKYILISSKMNFI